MVENDDVAPGRQPAVAWEQGPYVRRLLEGREKWATVIALVAIAAAFKLSWDRHQLSWVPLLFGVVASKYLFAVNCCSAEAEANCQAKSTGSTRWSWLRFWTRIGILGWFHIIAPLFFGLVATVTLNW